MKKFASGKSAEWAQLTEANPNRANFHLYVEYYVT